MPLRITTWNVNGIRNPFGHPPWRETRTFESMFDILEADIVVMQELKIQRKDFADDMVLVPGWDCYFTVPKAKKGYSGVAIYTRQSKCAPIRAEEGLLGCLSPPDSSVPYCERPADQTIGGYLTPSQLEEIADFGVDPPTLDYEGRCLVLEFPGFVILGVYSPANSNGQRDEFRCAFVCALDMRIRNLHQSGKRVILTGDLNVARSIIDIANHDQRLRDEGMTFQDYASMPNRRVFHQLLEGGDVFGDRDPGREEPVLWDVCRGFHEGRKGMYTHWEQKINARPGNYGSRIDYVLGSISMKNWFSESNIQEGLMGSDHCPVYAILKDKVELDGRETHLLDIMNPPGMFQDGQRMRKWSPQDMPALSGRLIPEFAQRRSIKDMFSKRQSTAPNGNDVAATPAASVPSAPPASIPSQSAQASDAEKRHERPKAATASPEKKRNLPSPSQTSRSLKRSKSSVSATAPSKGQKTLQGFFKPKATSNTPSNVPSTDSESTATAPSPKPSDMAPPVPPFDSIDKSGSSKSDISATQNENSAEPQAEDMETIEKNLTDEEKLVFDPIVSKEGWDKLFTKKGPPRCESHNEPCIQLTTKKAGVNCGRAFWICPRPVGPTGNKERGTQWRCPTFIWASDSRGAA